MTTEDVIRRTAEREKMFENCSGAVLAFSGGSDSMTLLSWFISNSPVPFAVGHVNHGLRKESDDEQKVLEAFCREKNVRIFSKKIDIPYKGCGFERSLRNTAAPRRPCGKTAYRP